MPLTKTPLVIEPEDLESLVHSEHSKSIVILDLNKEETYLKHHIPHAIRLDYNSIVSMNKPIFGLVPSDEALNQTLSACGITENTHVIAYDDEGGGMACRLLWTLDMIGHQHFSILNGGLIAWINENHTTESGPSDDDFDQSEYVIGQSKKPDTLATKEYILQNLNNDDVKLLDVRTPQEFDGTKKMAARGGHIPGAINFNWIKAIDTNNNARFLNNADLETMLADLGISKDKEIIVYCHSHHRSAHTYIALKNLGYNRVRGFAGSWSVWGNDPDLPVEI